MTPMRDAAQLARRLAARAHALVAELLPAGVREGHEWRVGSLAGEAGRSLSIHLTGSRALVWSDFSSGEAGDGLDLVAAVLFRGDLRAAMAWSRAWLGMSAAPAPETRRAALPEPPAPASDAEAEARRGAARRMWLSGQPVLPGSPVAGYLAGRGIDLAELPRLPGALRFHPELMNRESERAWPAMLAAIVGPDGRHAATHRTWLTPADGGRWTKAPLRSAKMVLGSFAGGHIPLARGASGAPLAQAPAGEAVAIAEGIETGLSVAVALPELRVLSAVSLGNLARVALPPAVREVILAADNDVGNPGAERALQRAVDTFVAQGRIVRIARSDVGKDFNDALTAAERAG